LTPVWIQTSLCQNINAPHVEARSLESLMEGHNWFLNQFLRFLWDQSSIIDCFLSLFAKASLNTFHHLRSAIHDYRLGLVYTVMSIEIFWGESELCNCSSTFSWQNRITSWSVAIGVWLSDSYPAFFLPIATTSNKNF
jgi:hypothetical protein